MSTETLRRSQDRDGFDFDQDSGRASFRMTTQVLAGGASCKKGSRMVALPRFLYKSFRWSAKRYLAGAPGR
jgi:hypothetical protein